MLYRILTVIIDSSTAQSFTESFYIADNTAYTKQSLYSDSAEVVCRPKLCFAPVFTDTLNSLVGVVL